MSIGLRACNVFLFDGIRVELKTGILCFALVSVKLLIACSLRVMDRFIERCETVANVCRLLMFQATYRCGLHTI